MPEAQGPELTQPQPDGLSNRRLTELGGGATWWAPASHPCAPSPASAKERARERAAKNPSARGSSHDYSELGLFHISIFLTFIFILLEHTLK